MKKALEVEVRTISKSGLTKEIIVKNDRVNINSEILKWLHRHSSFNKCYEVQVYVTNGYIETYCFTYYPEYKGTEKEINPNALYAIIPADKSKIGMIEWVQPCRYCATGEQVY